MFENAVEESGEGNNKKNMSFEGQQFTKLVQATLGHKVYKILDLISVV